MTVVDPSAPVRSPGFPAPGLLMLLLGLSGMAIGLAIDASAVAPSTLTALCTGGAASVGASVGRHLSVLPATHVTMLLGSALASAMVETVRHPVSPAAERVRRLAHDAAAFLFMLAGMWLAGWLVPLLFERLEWTLQFAGLAAAMIGGMIAGMAFATWLGTVLRGRPAGL